MSKVTVFLMAVASLPSACWAGASGVLRTTTEMTSTHEQTSNEAFSKTASNHLTRQHQQKASSETASLSTSKLTAEKTSSDVPSATTQASTSILEAIVTATSATSTRTQTSQTSARSKKTLTVPVTATTVTATTASLSQTPTSTLATLSSTTTSQTATATTTMSSSATVTQTTTETTTRTWTTTTRSTSSSSTTTPYCFETNVLWSPLDMPGTLPSREHDEFACQEKCLRTPGCSHFSFWRVDRTCHLQDRYAQRREPRDGFTSGPFQCWSYLIPGQYVKMSNTSYLPARFRCMQTGVSWSPDMTTSKYIEGERDEVVFACQQKCLDTEGCAHFTVMFPGLCRLAASTAVPLPAERAISGPPAQECEDEAADAPLGHTFMRKYESIPTQSTTSPMLRVATIGPAALMVSAATMALLWRRRWPNGAQPIPVPVCVDLEESLQHCPQESISSQAE